MTIFRHSALYLSIPIASTSSGPLTPSTLSISYSYKCATKFKDNRIESLNRWFKFTSNSPKTTSAKDVRQFDFYSHTKCTTACKCKSSMLDFATRAMAVDYGAPSPPHDLEGGRCHGSRWMTDNKEDTHTALRLNMGLGPVLTKWRKDTLISTWRNYLCTLWTT